MRARIVNSRKANRAAAALLLAAVAWLTLVGLDYRDDPFFTAPVSDALSYHRWAERLAADGWADEPSFHQAPLYPVLLSAVYAAAAPEHRAGAVLAVQSLLFALAVALLVPIGRRLFGDAAAGIAAACVALAYAPLAFHSLKWLPVALALATQAAALWCVLLAAERRTAWTRALAGAAVGVAALARAEMLLFAAVAALGLAWTGGPGARARAAAVASFVAGAALALAPATAHNLSRGDAVLVASSGGENLYIGNQRGADGGHTPLDPRAGDLFSQRALAREIAERETDGTVSSAGAVSRYWTRRALSEIAADPLGWIGVETRKLARLVSPGDPTDLYSLPLERGRFVPTLWAAPLATAGLWLLALLAIPGLRAIPSCRWRPWAVLVAVHAATLAAFFVNTRLRLPFLFWLCPAAGLAVSRLWREVRGGHRGLPLLVLGLLLAAGVSEALWVRPPLRETMRLASVLSTADRLDDSLAVLEPLLAKAEPDPLVLDQAGWVHQKRGDLDEAETLYRRALDAELPAQRVPQTLVRLARVQEQGGRREDAWATLERAARVAPDEAGVRYERGLFLARAGEREAAVEELQRAAALEPRWAAPREALQRLGR